MVHSQGKDSIESFVIMFSGTLTLVLMYAKLAEHIALFEHQLKRLLQIVLGQHLGQNFTKVYFVLRWHPLAVAARSPDSLPLR